MDSRSDVIVLGAGPAGLAAALRAARSGASVTLVEAADEVGGLCRTFQSDGCRYDMGGHIPFFRTDDRVGWAEDIMGDDLIWVDRPVARVVDGAVPSGAVAPVTRPGSSDRPWARSSATAPCAGTSRRWTAGRSR